ncbi:hypothetical protein B0181_03370 [Moraxella caviae]|uniref:Uncharacterized protein n=1 Tax=Moraxella caviae TaxID=34060 RepID=A0A1T0A6J4_9GAMM|nr:hypothetical protein [Moraxella caviae]OOR91355.1 hypothetical protein B0181_03370 [Moraxella caviae]STZ13967.1 Uncharacterised protein [Moraxella caviae]VEW12992.1 Uncharacterised protein [Moraxella caviae]
MLITDKNRKSQQQIMAQTLLDGKTFTHLEMKQQHSISSPERRLCELRRFGFETVFTIGKNPNTGANYRIFRLVKLPSVEAVLRVFGEIPTQYKHLFKGQPC